MIGEAKKTKYTVMKIGNDHCTLTAEQIKIRSIVTTCSVRGDTKGLVTVVMLN